MQAAQKLFILALAAVVIVAIGLMVLLYTSLLPHFAEIGDWLVWVVRLGMVCASCLMVAFTWFKILSMHHYSQFVKQGDVVSHIGKRTPTVVSAIHEQAKVIPQVAISKAEEHEPLPSEAYVILDMHRQGIGFKKIAEATLWSEYQVRKLCNQADGKP